MKAIICDKFGIDKMKVEEVTIPEPGEKEVLVKVYASDITTHNHLLIIGKPFFVRLMGLGVMRPKYRIPGSEVAGVVTKIGLKVTQFKVGDEVFGYISHDRFGAYAEYAAVAENTLAIKPAKISFEEAAGVPQSALVAYDGLINKGKLQQGQKVLIYGASGGIGTFAVQIAKYFGAEVTGVCSTKNIELVKALGADYVIDYSKVNYSNIDEKYDVIFAIAFTSLKYHLRLLKQNGKYVSTGGPNLKRVFQDMVLGPIISGKGKVRVEGGWTVNMNQKDLIFIKELIEQGKIKPIIDKCFTLSDSSEAFKYFASGHARGKVIITIPQD